MARQSDARDRLVASAAELVHRLGYSAVSVADICADAGLQKGSFYHFFKSKHALVLATLERHADRMNERFEVLLDEEGDARTQLEAFFSTMHAGMVARVKKEGCLLGCPVGNLSQEMADRDPQLRSRLADIFACWHAKITAVIERGVAQGSLHVSDPSAAAELLLALSQGATILAKVSNDPDVFRRIARWAVRAIEDHAGPAGDPVATPASTTASVDEESCS